MGILFENDRPTVLETCEFSQGYDGDNGEVFGAGGYASQVYSHRLVVAVWANKALAWQCNEGGMVRVLFTKLDFDSVQLSRTDAVTTLRAVFGGHLATASRIPRAHGKLE